MKLIHLIPTSGALALILSALNLSASGLEAALKATLDDAPQRPVDALQPTFEIFNHIFSVKPVEMIEKNKSKFTLEGKLTRIASAGGLNEEITYRIIKEKAAVKEITWRVSGGEWRPLSRPMTDALGDYRKGVPMSEEKQREVERALEKAVDDTWQRAAEFLITHIALRHC
jgi:hypothetical protein